MQVIEATTVIHAPIARCFELSLSIDLEAEAGRPQRLRAIRGRTCGIIGPEEQVTWRTKQFGIWVTHTSVISQYRPHEFFEDSMVRGVFRFFRHQHTFRALADGATEMRDYLTFAMPYGPFGLVLEKRFVRKRMEDLLEVRNALIKRTAEADGRRQYP
ncbi:SRPBCC family protein [Silvibacterium sp.]|uniref:SRPBCC family protein n=1 Tax=Silvibacterium sp. TaxID=1964179 RepID=UPI0039E59358